MSDGYPVVPLGDVLRLALDVVPVDVSASYPMAGVYSFGRGLLTREPLPGSQTTYKVLHRLHEDDFVLSQLKGWEGAIARVPASFDGKFLSPVFSTFKPISDRLDIRFLDWCCKQSKVWDMLRSGARGMGARRDSVSPTRFLETPIPLPPLAEQRRIVARIEALAAKIAEARGLRRQAVEEAKTLYPAAAREAFTTVSSEAPIRPMKGLFRFRNDLIRPTDGATGTLRFVGLQHVESDTGKRLGEDFVPAEMLDGRKFKFSPGEIVYGYLRPYLNKVWVADREGICSVDQYVLRPNATEVETEYLAHYMRSPSFVERANVLTNNLMLPRLRSGLLESVDIPQPPLLDQRRIVAYLDGVQAKVDAVKRLQAETAAELDALLPAVLDRAFRGEL